MSFSNTTYTHSLKVILVLILLSNFTISDRLLAAKDDTDRSIKNYNAQLSSWSPAQRRQHEVYAVGAGASVSYSSLYHWIYANYWLDYTTDGAHAWCPRSIIMGQWIQVSDLSPKVWTSIILQGRGDANDWVSSYKVMYTVNGREWKYVENGRVFPGVSDRYTKVKVTFEKPVYARVLRIYPQTWNERPCVRFDAIYMNFDSKR